MPFGANWSDIKWFAIMVAAGVTTAIAVELVTRRMQDLAILSARAELEKLIVATTAKQNSPVPSAEPAANVIIDNSGIGYSNLT